MLDVRLFTISAAVLLVGVAYASVLPYLGFIAIHEIGLSNSLYGYLTGLSSLIVTLLSLTLGFIFDRFHFRPPLVICCAVAGAAGFAIILQYRSVAAFVIVSLLLLPFSAVLFSQVFAYGKSILNRRQGNTDFAISALRALFSFAWVAAPPITAVVVNYYSAYAAIVVAIGCYIITAASFCFLAWSERADHQKSDKKAMAERPQSLDGWQLVGILPRISAMILIKMALILNAMGVSLVILIDMHQEPLYVGYATAVPPLVEVPFILIWGKLLARLGKKKIIVFNAMLFAAYLFSMYNSNNIEVILCLQLVNGIAAAALISITIGYLQETIPGRLGLSSSLIDVVSASATLFSGLVFAAVTTKDSYAPVFAVASAAALVGGVITFLERQPVGLPSQQLDPANRKDAAPNFGSSPVLDAGSILPREVSTK